MLVKRLYDGFKESKPSDAEAHGVVSDITKVAIEHEHNLVRPQLVRDQRVYEAALQFLEIGENLVIDPSQLQPLGKRYLVGGFGLAMSGGLGLSHGLWPY